MLRRTLVTLSLLATLGAALRTSAQTVDVRANAREAIAAMSTRCDRGPQVHAAFAVLSPSDLDVLASERDRTARLLAHWERERRVARGGLDGGGVTRFLRVLETELGRAPPAWWKETLRTARVHSATSTTVYDVAPARTARFTSAVPWGTRTLRGPAGTPSLRSIPLPPDTSVDHVDAIQSGARIVVAAFDPGRGGAPIEVRAYRAGPIERAWTATACTAARAALGGQGDLVIELDVIANELRVWSAEPHGLAVDALELGTGAVRWRFSTDFWSARHGR